jgi:hypothetical protein
MADFDGPSAAVKIEPWTMPSSYPQSAPSIRGGATVRERLAKTHTSNVCMDENDLCREDQRCEANSTS